jgi:hypothetical protein
MKSRTYKLEDAFIVDSDLDNTNLNGPTWDHSSQASIFRVTPNWMFPIRSAAGQNPDVEFARAWTTSLENWHQFVDLRCSAEPEYICCSSFR